MHGGPRSQDGVSKTTDANLEVVSVQTRNFTLILDGEKPTQFMIELLTRPWDI